MNKQSVVQIGIVIVILWLIGLTVFQLIKPKKVAYIDVNELFVKYEATKQKQKEFELKKTQITAGVDSLLQGWQKELQDFEKNRLSMTKKERELQQQVLQGKQINYENYSRGVQQQLIEEQQQMTQTVINEINFYIEDYGKRHKYKIIIGATGDGGLLYADEALNITEDLLKELNEDYQ